MNIIKLDDSIGVAAQISPADVSDIAAAGYRVLINNRPDGEEPGQPSAAEIARAAEAEGLEYYHMPVSAMDFPGSDFAAMCDLFDDSESPVLAFCRSGTRCANLWLSSRSPDELQAAASLVQGRGFDLSMAARFLQRRG
ncbi:MAG: TIGR01244 family sulfur transferase [Pseudomonadota bacterium]